MPSITEILGNPLSDIIKGAGDIIAKFVPDPQAKINAQMELAKLQETMEEKLIQADVDWAKAQADVIETEMKSDSWLGKNWRPIVMMTFTYIIAHNFIFAQLFNFKILPIPPDMWALLKLGMGGYIIGRSAEKIVPAVTTAIVQAKKPNE